MDLRIFTEPQQGATYDDLLAVAKRTEQHSCYSGFFRSDHYLKMGGVSGLPGPTDAWITLAGLARETSRIRLGTLVNAVTFRQPGPLAITVAQVDAMSGGRIELGLGAGWYEAEHRAYGLEFPPVGERFDILEEQLAVITGLWSTSGGFNHRGDHYTVVDSPGLPKPQQSPVPIIMGGGGPKRTPMLAATYAAEFNAAFKTLPDFVAGCDRVRACCEVLGRDPNTVTYSAALVLACGENQAEFTRRAAAIGREPDELRANGACGTVDEVIATLTVWQQAGAARIYLQILDLGDLEHLDLIAERVAAHL